MGRIVPATEAFKVTAERFEYFREYRKALRQLKIGDHILTPYENTSNLSLHDFRARVRDGARRVGIRVTTELTIHGIRVTRVEEKK